MIRVAEPGDAAACAEIYAPSVLEFAISFEEEPPSAEEMRKRIVTTLERLPWLVAVSADEVAGYAYAARHRERAAYRWAVDVAVYVRDRFHGRGIGRALYERLLETLTRLGYRRAYAGVVLPNDASVALHRAVGFEPIGVYERVGWKLGHWHDVAWFGCNLGPSDDGAAPAEPILFSRYSFPTASPKPT